MLNKIKMAAALAGLFFQVVVMILYGFTEIDVSRYVYFALWILCGAIILRSLDAMDKAN